ncbi:MAG: sugar phosphorylase, partial [Anaerolineales bacterium]|nr:sugar phosphorylase [Anaerolineales bacterium]
PGVTPLACLGEFLDAHVGQVVNGIHVLPFFPSSSDDGFSVVDYLRVDPALGSWDDIHRLAERRRLMIDAVLNHASSQSEWFQAYLRGEPGHRDFFIEIAGEADLSHVVRPRTTPLGTVFAASGGDKQVWTTFSADQVDLNFGNPQVLLRAVGVVLEYVAHRASMIRLDAIAYLWKELGTACIHLAQTHRIVQLLRVVLDEVAPHVKLVTETNVPHAENVSYFGDGQNEAQWVYNFVLPPLVLHALWRGSSAALADWVSGLTLPSPRVTFFNFLACHDGIGLNPALGILPASEIEALVERVLHRGGEVSAKRNPDGSESPYELNVNYFDALSDSPSEALQTQVDRFMVAQSIMLALRGVPGIYFHSLFGSRGWPEGFRGSGMKRTINRQKLRRADLEAELAQDGTLRRQVLDRFLRLLRVRAACKGFHPHGSQEVAPAGEAVLALWRASPLGEEPVLCLHNLRSQAQTVVGVARGRAMHDLLSGEHMEDPRRIPLAPYQVRWLRTDEASHG